jgi:hypothetical protein
MKAFASFFRSRGRFFGAFLVAILGVLVAVPCLADPPPPIDFGNTTGIVVTSITNGLNAAYPALVVVFGLILTIGVVMNMIRRAAH